MADRVARTVQSIARGEVVAGVDRCLIRVELAGDVCEVAVGPGGPRGGPLAAGDPFRIASVTKVVTAATVLALCERGLCMLDDPATRHLPSAAAHLISDAPERHRLLTVRALLDHTSGLPDFFATPTIATALQAGRGRRTYSPVELVSIAMTEGARSTSGRRRYTDTGFVLAGLMVEELTGRPLHEAYRSLVFEPATMNATWLESGADLPRTVPPSRHLLDGVDITERLEPTVDWAGGGLVSTAADLARLLRALREGSVLSPASWSDMTAWSPGPDGYYDDYGVGLGRYRLGELDAVGHHGYWGAFAFWIPVIDATISGTVNIAGVDRRPLLAAVVDVISSTG